MQKIVYEYMERWKMAAPGMRILAGFSGGADSTALLQLLWEYGKKRGIEVRALHVNHGIRGAEADEDQAFCERFCRERGIGFQAVYADVPKVSEAEGIGLEEAGRKVRYRAFEQVLKAGGADRVALAHHQNDQAETMLFHLMRGTGVRGLRGMEPVRGPYIRPFLCVSRAQIEQWLKEKGIGWAEDSSNQEQDYVRNQIRHGVLALMEEIRPESIRHMAGTAQRLLELEDYLNGELLRWRRESVREKDNGYEISLDAWARMHPMMRKQVVFWCLEQLLGEVKAVHVEQVCALAEGRRGNRVTLPEDVFAVQGYKALLLKKGYGRKKTEETVYCEPGGEYHYMGAVFRLTVEKYEKNAEIPVNRYTKWFDYDKIKDNVALRTRKPGDYLELSGGIHKKLKAYLIDCKVPREERDGCILLADGSHIIWVTGMRISEGYKVTEQTRRVLKVQMRKEGGTERMEKHHIDVMLEEDTVNKRIKELGAEISRDYAGKTVFLICILKGSVYFTCELAKRITVPVVMDFMQCSSYGAATISSGVVTLSKDLDQDIKGRNVIIIEDIIDSGRTLRHLKELLRQREPASLRICTLLDKPDRRVTDVHVDYTGFQIEDKFVVGYGLDYGQLYRNLPYIGVVEFD